MAWPSVTSPELSSRTLDQAHKALTLQLVQQVRTAQTTVAPLQLQLKSESDFLLCVDPLLHRVLPASWLGPSRDDKRPSAAWSAAVLDSYR